LYSEKSGNKVLDSISTFFFLTPRAFFTEIVWSQRTAFKMDTLIFRACKQMCRYLELVILWEETLSCGSGHDWYSFLKTKEFSNLHLLVLEGNIPNVNSDL
jgi:hypothetical protein